VPPNTFEAIGRVVRYVVVGRVLFAERETNDEIDAWEEYDGLKVALAEDPVPPELAEALDRRYNRQSKLVNN
jgi:hypothetical protein